MMSQWPSPAKLNLFLYITGQRADGYHTLQTLFQFVDYGDTISIEPRGDGQIHLLTPVEGVASEDNLIVRAARLLMKAAAESGRLPEGSGADIRIEKRLPMGGGLGAGHQTQPRSLSRLTIFGAVGYQRMNWPISALRWERMFPCSSGVMPPLPRVSVKFSRQQNRKKNGIWWLIPA